MFRKTIFAIAAVATIAATSLASTTADAKPFKGGFGHRGWGIGAAVLLGSAAVATSCYQYGWYRGVYTRYWVCD